MKIILLLYIFAYTFCSTEIYNITLPETVEINQRIIETKGIFEYLVKPKICNNSNDFYLRLKIDHLISSFSIEFRLEKKNNLKIKEVKAYGFTSYPSDKELTDDISYPLVNVLNGEFSHDTHYEYYTYGFLAQKNLKYASISIYIKNRDCEYIGITAYSKQN